MKKFFGILLMVLMLISAVFAATGDSSTALKIDLVNQDPDPAQAGDIIEVRVGIQNLGGESANDVELQLQPSYPFELLSGDDGIEYVGNIAGYQNDENVKIVKFKVRVASDAPAGTYDLSVAYTQSGTTAKVVSKLEVEVEGSESAEVIHIDKTTLIPGEESQLKFVINNVGSSPLTDLTFSWLNEDKVILPVGSGNKKFISEIPVGGSAELIYTVIADTNADAGLYELQLSLAYDDGTGSSTTSESIAGMYVGGVTDFDVAFSESNSGEMSFTVANVGSNPAYSVSVEVPEQTGWMTTGSSSSIIGNLNNGDYTLVSYTLSGSSNVLKLNIVYTDTQGKRQTVEKEVVMNTRSSSTGFTGTSDNGSAPTFQRTGSRMNPMGSLQTGASALSSLLPKVIIGIVVLIAGIVGIKVYKSKHKKRK